MFTDFKEEATRMAELSSRLAKKTQVLVDLATTAIEESNKGVVANNDSTMKAAEEMRKIQAEQAECESKATNLDKRLAEQNDREKKACEEAAKLRIAATEERDKRQTQLTKESVDLSKEKRDALDDYNQKCQKLRDDHKRAQGKSKVAGDDEAKKVDLVKKLEDRQKDLDKAEMDLGELVAYDADLDVLQQMKKEKAEAEAKKQAASEKAEKEAKEMEESKEPAAPSLGEAAGKALAQAALASAAPKDDDSSDKLAAAVTGIVTVVGGALGSAAEAAASMFRAKEVSEEQRKEGKKGTSE